MSRVLLSGSTPAEVFAAVELLPTPCAVALDSGCRDVRLNRAFLRLLGGDECTLPTKDLPLAQAIQQNAHVDETELDVQCNGGTLRFIGAADPIRDADGKPCGAVAVFIKLAQAYERAAERVRFLARAGERLAESLDSEQIYETLADILIPRFADAVAISTFDEHKGFELVYRRDAPQSAKPKRIPPAGELLDAQRPRFSKNHRAIAVPMRSRGRLMGAVVVAGKDRYNQDDLDVLEELARRSASAIENARAFQQARHIAEAFQQALLPQNLPDVPELRFDAYYLYSDDESRVGGDWYDAVELVDGRVVVSIGDVTGRGLEAALVMSKVRQAIGTLAISNQDPSKVLDAADFEVRRLFPDTIVTAFVGIFDPRANTFDYATAGHPPPFLQTADGAILQLPAHGLPVGLRSEREPAPVKWYLQQGARIVLYTDGLVESTRNFFEGERRVTQALVQSVRSRQHPTARQLCRSVLHDGSRDDVAVMIVDVQTAQNRTLHWHFDATDARIAHELRGTLLNYLRQLGDPKSDYTSAELVIGELIGNVCRHAPGEADVEIDWRGDHPVMHLIDRGAGYEAYRILPVDPYSESGRGLFLVQSAAKDLAVTRLPGYGSHTRAVLNVARR